MSSCNLSRQEMNRRRLQYLGQINKDENAIISRSRKASPLMPAAVVKAETKSSPVDVAVAPGGESPVDLHRRLEPVIDLCDSSSEDEVVSNVKTLTSRVKNPYASSSDDDKVCVQATPIKRTAAASNNPYATSSDDEIQLVKPYAASATVATKHKPSVPQSTAKRIRNPYASFSDDENRKRRASPSTSSSSQKKKKRSVSQSSSANIRSGQKSANRPKSLSSLIDNSSNDSHQPLTVATYNVWFGPAGDGEPHGARRMQALVDKLTKAVDTLPHVIGLQEVTEALAQHLKPLLESRGYRVYRQEQVSYGVALAVHERAALLDVGWQPYRDTIMARGFLYVRCQVSDSTINRGRQVLVCTTHLESFVRAEQVYTGSRERQLQVQQLQEFCRQKQSQHSDLEACLFLGDLNWDDSRRNAPDPELTSLATDFSDVWLSSKPKSDKGYTYDGKLNCMLSNNLRRRFDRCLVTTTGGDIVSVRSAEIVGTDPVHPAMTFQKYNPWKQTHTTMPLGISDHFGLVVQLNLGSSNE